MNAGRLAALAVIFMMVLSAFVAIPAYNASADHENHDDEEHDHDHDEDNGDHNDHGLPSFSDLDENGNGTIEFNEMMDICPEDQSESNVGVFLTNTAATMVLWMKMSTRDLYQTSQVPTMDLTR